MTSIKQEARSLFIEGRAFINGHYTNSCKGRFIEKVSPADGLPVEPVSACTSEDIDLAVSAASDAFKAGSWADISVKDRKFVCFSLAKLMQDNRRELALLDTLETGRAFRNYDRDSIPKAIEALRYFTEAADKHYGQSYSADPDSFAITAREPLGVIGLITPWNDPMVVTFWKLSPALLMGNSVVLKPAEQSSYSALKIAELARQAGLPDGVLNVVPGYGEEAGRALALHNDVNGLFFTGSSSTGKKILQYSGQSNMKKIGLECGGKSPYIVSDKCRDLQKAAATLARNMFYNQGQICSAPSRGFLHKNIKQQFIDLLLIEAAQWMPGDPFDEQSKVGCIVSVEQKSRVQGFIDRAKNSGMTSVSPVPDRNWNSGHCSILPTIFVDPVPDSEIMSEEIFGPVLTLTTVENMNEALESANQSRYGLAAAVWTDDLAEAHVIARRLKAGIVHINSYGDDDNSIPFGGIKESGIGKDKSLVAFEEYSFCKSTWIQHGVSN